MELWIRSQDGTILEKEERFMIIRGMDVYYIANNGDIYGKYKAKERALEVLDEIQNILIDYKEMSRVVYQMPQD